MVYKTTKELLDKVVSVASVRPYRNGAVITGKIDGVPYKHQFGSGSKAEGKLLALLPRHLPVSVKIVKKGRCLDLEFIREVKHA